MERNTFFREATLSKMFFLPSEKGVLEGKHYENTPIQIRTENFTTKKMKIFR